MPNRLIMLFSIVLFGSSCASSTAGGDTEAIPMLMQLQRTGIEPDGELFVLDDGAWGLASKTACSGAQGTVSQAEVDSLRGYVADPALKTLPTTCPDRALKLTDSKFQVVACWDSSQPTAPASAAALAKFFDDRIAELHWDGRPKMCEEMGPPTLDVGKLDQPDNGSSPQRKN